MREENCTSIREKLVEIIVEKLGADEKKIVDETDLYCDFGADSLDMVEIELEVEKEFQITISEEDVVEIRTFKNLVDVVEKHFS